MRLSLRLLLALPLLGLLAAAAQQGSDPSDPEAGERGRSSYLGRDIARTMHWTGAEWLMRASRDEEENSKLLFENLQLTDGEVACDFGCGNGFYTLPMAAAVGEKGAVFAVDIQQEMLELLGLRVKEAGLENVRPVLGTISDPKLPKASCDAIVQIDVYHELSHPVTTLKHLRNALTEDGELILVEFRLEDREVPIKLKHKMSKAQMLLEMKANGLSFAREFDELPWQHLVAFTRDPDFPREAGQTIAEGSAVAEGFARAWKRGDLQEIGGYLGRRVRTLRDGATETTASDAWLARWLELREAAGESFWANGYGAAEVATRALDTDGAAPRVELTLSQGDNAQRWLFERDAEGPWTMVEEQLVGSWKSSR